MNVDQDSMTPGVHPAHGPSRISTDGVYTRVFIRTWVRVNASLWNVSVRWPHDRDEGRASRTYRLTRPT
jgi:hypothetical protein